MFKTILTFFCLVQANGFVVLPNQPLSFGNWGSSLRYFEDSSSLSKNGRFPTRRWNSNDSDDQDDFDENDEDEGDEEIPERPYGNRSLAWTNRYRRLIPYEMARARAIAMGVTSRAEYLSNRRGPYQISRPDEMYAQDWVSWDEFLGKMRPYEEARQLVRMLNLKSMEEYRDFIRSDTQRAEGLRIPAKPEIVYRDSGWEGPHVFFGTSTEKQK